MSELLAPVGERSEELTSNMEIGSLAELVGYQLRQAQSALFRDFTSISTRFGISPGEFSLLTLIKANPGVCQSDLTSMYKVDKSTISLSIGGLAKRGLVYRTRSESDNRYYTLWLTDVGRKLLEMVSAQVDAQERAMDAVLRPGERGCLLDMLRRIAGAFEGRG